ncbi:hypothetical protein VAA_00187 [Vibrio anguillarum 775]|nr:hypothetical protein VAA_00187 [Vibrio anguillarum 775]ARV26853.1 hypothetical protein A6A12_0176 [Vibrio anguillarum]
MVQIVTDSDQEQHPKPSVVAKDSVSKRTQGTSNGSYDKKDVHKKWLTKREPFHLRY